MRRIVLLLCTMAGILCFLLSASVTAGESLLEYVPGRPLAALRAADFGALAARVKVLPAAEEYLNSNARAAYADSKLALKLDNQAQRLSKLAEMPLTLATLAEKAPGETVLALYDIGNLQFLLLVRLDPVAQAELPFVQNKDRFTERVYNGRTYLARRDERSGQVFLFYQQDDLLFVANNVGLLESALLAQSKPAEQPRLVDEEDYRHLWELAPSFAEFDALLFLDLNLLKDDRYFRTYWVWNNWQEFAGLKAGMVGFSCDGAQVVERRVLLGDTIAATPRGLAFGGAGMTGYQAGGEGAGKQLTAFLGWDLSGLEIDPHVTSRLLVAQPVVDEQTGLQTVRLGAALDAAGLSPEAVIETVTARLAEKRPALRGRLTPQTKDGVTTLTLLPGLPGAYAAQKGEILLLANDEALLREMQTQVDFTEAGVWRAARVDGAAATAVAEFVNQADHLGLVYDSGADFTTGVLKYLLVSAGRFQHLQTVTRPIADGLWSETVWH